MTSNEKLFDKYLRHQIHLMLYSGGLRDTVLPQLAATEQALYDAIVKWTSKKGVPRTLTGASGRKWQSSISKAISEIRYPVWNSINAQIASELKELVVSEASVAAHMIETSLPVHIVMARPAVTQLESIVNSQPFEGRTLKQWMNRTAQADVQKMLIAAKIGIVQGQAPTEIARSIMGTSAMRYRDGISRKAFRDVESVLLTLTNGIQNEAKQALYAANSDVIQKEQFVATLDVRTTLECASYDGQIFQQGLGPIPPLHFRCRSLRVPYIKYGNIGDRPYDSRTEKELLNEYTNKGNLAPVKTRSELPRGHKTKYDKYSRKRGDELVGQVPVRVSYNEWLKTQTKEFQDKRLGPTRAKMFRKGDIHLSKFVARNGDVLTLKELTRKGMSLP